MAEGRTGFPPGEETGDSEGERERAWLPLAAGGGGDSSISGWIPSFPPRFPFQMSRLEKQSSLPEGDYDNTAPGLELDETG